MYGCGLIGGRLGYNTWALLLTMLLKRDVSFFMNSSWMVGSSGEQKPSLLLFLRNASSLSLRLAFMKPCQDGEAYKSLDNVVA